jgi:hydroxyacylglutathione hydrolase
MKVQVFVVGMLSTNCYVVHDEKTKNAIIIDPGFDSPIEAKQLLAYIEKEGLLIKFVVDTHGHDDHIGGNTYLKKKYNIPICIHSKDAEALDDTNKTSPANVLLSEGDTVGFGEEKLKVIHTPGHTLGSICLLNERVVFTGDTLFAGGIGRTDFVGGSDRDMNLSLGRLQRLPENLIVYPGHGSASTIGAEKSSNPFLRWL